MPTARFDEGARLLPETPISEHSVRCGGEERLTDPADDLDEWTIKTSCNREQESVCQARQTGMRDH